MKHQTGFIFLTSRWWSSLREHCSDLPPHTADAWTQPAGARLGHTQPLLERRETLPGGTKDHGRILSGSKRPQIHVAVTTSGVPPHNSPTKSFSFFWSCRFSHSETICYTLLVQTSSPSSCLPTLVTMKLWTPASPMSLLQPRTVLLIWWFNQSFFASMRTTWTTASIPLCFCTQPSSHRGESSMKARPRSLTCLCRNDELSLTFLHFFVSHRRFGPNFEGAGGP